MKQPEQRMPLALSSVKQQVAQEFAEANGLGAYYITADKVWHQEDQPRRSEL